MEPDLRKLIPLAGSEIICCSPWWSVWDILFRKPCLLLINRRIWSIIHFVSLTSLIVAFLCCLSNHRSRQTAITGSFSTLTRWQASVHRIVSVMMREASIHQLGGLFVIWLPITHTLQNLANSEGGYSSLTNNTNWEIQLGDLFQPAACPWSIIHKLNHKPEEPCYLLLMSRTS